MKAANLFIGAMWLILLITGCGRDGLKRYYTKISPEEFASYYSVSRRVKSLNYNLYSVSQHTEYGGKLNFFIVERLKNNERTGLFKMSEDVELKNDSTFILYDAFLKMSGDTVNWKNGIWFYQGSKKSGTYSFRVDSMPKAIPKVNYQNLKPGIYHYYNGFMYKISDKQSNDEFEKLSTVGFYYLPNPGRFYSFAKIREIQ